jgi:hypothetical protein
MDGTTAFTKNIVCNNGITTCDKDRRKLSCSLPYVHQPTFECETYHCLYHFKPKRMSTSLICATKNKQESHVMVSSLLIKYDQEDNSSVEHNLVNKNVFIIIPHNICTSNIVVLMECIN